MPASIVANREELPMMLTAQDLQRVLGLSRPKVYELIARKDFPAVRFGRAIRVARDELFVWLAAQFGRKTPARPASQG
jgi:excisionase family DNA binding protein